MTKPLKIYVAGPYTASTAAGLELNTMRAIDVGLALYQKGHFPFVPHLTHWVDLRARQLGIPMAWEDYIRWDDAWLDSCDALLYLAPSKGADLELASAQRKGLIIFRSVEEVPTVVKTPLVSNGAQDRLMAE